MPNIASLLKAEISRVARKEVRTETQTLKKATASYRSDIAALKRRMQALEQEVKALRKAATRQTPASPTPQQFAAPEQTASLRFSAKGLAAQRQRLGLSAADCGLLLGASGLSIYKWESGKTRPRANFIAAIASLRSLGKKEAEARLASLRQSGL